VTIAPAIIYNSAPDRIALSDWKGAEKSNNYHGKDQAKQRKKRLTHVA